MLPEPSPLLSDQMHQCLHMELILFEGCFDLPGEGQLLNIPEDAVYSLSLGVHENLLEYVRNQRRIQDFLKEGYVSMRVQGKRPRPRNGGGGSWKVMIEYVVFRHFDFSGINLSHLRHYY